MSVDKISWEEAVQSLRDDPAQQDLVKSCFYDDPLLAAAQRYADSTEWQAIQKILADISIGKALDVGAGRGIASYALAKDGWQVTALEPDGSSVVGAGAIRQLAIDANLDIKVIEEFGEKLPFADNTFDLVHARAVLHHAKNLQMFCDEISRVLKPNGMLIASREHVINTKEDLPVFLAMHPLHKLYGGESAYLLEEYCSVLKSSGFDKLKFFNRFESDINLYPNSQKAIHARFCAKIKIPLPFVIVKWLMTFYGKIDQTPGRVFTFIVRKK